MKFFQKVRQMGAVLLACAVAVLTVTSCDSDATIRAIRQNGALNVGYVSCAPTEDAPFLLADNAGLTAAPAAKTAKSLDTAVRFTRLTAESAYLSLLAGSVDCLWNVAPPSKETVSSVRTIETGVTYRQLILTTKESGITRLADVSGKILAVVSGSDAQTELHNAAVMESSLKQIKSCAAMQDIITALDTGEADCAAVDEPQAMYAIEQFREAGHEREFRFIETPIAENQLVIVCRAADGELCSRIAECYVKMAQDGDIKALSERWIGTDEQEDSRQRSQSV